MDKDEVQKDVEKYSALETLSSSEGGQLLVQSCIKDVLSTLESLASGYKRLTHIEFIAYSAELSEKLDIIRILTRSGINNAAAKDALKELLLAEQES